MLTRLIWASLVAIWMGGLGCVSNPPEVPVSTTYTITNAAYDGTYVESSHSFLTSLTGTEDGLWAVFHFGGITWDHTLLTDASFAFQPTLFTSGTYAVDVVVAKDGVPTGPLLTDARRVQIGTFTVSANGTDNQRVSFPVKTAAVVVEAEGTFTWTPTGAYTAIGTATSDAFGTLNAAWTKHERNPTDNTLFLDRSITLIVRTLTTGSAITFDDTTGTAPTLTVTTSSSNTGLVGTQYIRDWERGRASGVIECPKTGWDIAADEAVRDGHSGMMVAPEAWDPPEPRPRPLRPPSLNPRRRG